MTIEFFDSHEEMLDRIAQGVEAAKSRATPRQNAITYGDYWMRAWDDIMIFGYIYTKEEMDAIEIKLGASQEELEYEHRVYDRSYRDGFRFGKAYSVIEPNGELGDTHVCDMIKITKEEFYAAKALNWSQTEIANFTDKVVDLLVR
jgi:hypothetical protein